ncbi:anthranilate synthase component I family protein [Pontibacter silvestris]|uniref:Anthranilate synthase component I family protein n=1 Tax=Pontibacter silvestris TaxID=2305183 RepID=A0ABW4WZK7_9BACT|nr:anthranilate synthase component I family protein [Pontibacter silvestris]MCC9138240.1 anthranilate synthase component I family protein [Pontibacter silvestris]
MTDNMYSVEIKAHELPVPLDEFRLKALAWADQFPNVAYYNPNDIPYPHNGFQHMLAVSSGPALTFEETSSLDDLRKHLKENKSLLCGYLGYDLKNQIEALFSQNIDKLGFPLLHFFEPILILNFNHEDIRISNSEVISKKIISDILATPTPLPASPIGLEIKQRVSPDDYKLNVEHIKEHVVVGNVYELNYCIEFYAEKVHVQPLPLYLALNAASPTPFSGYLKCSGKYLLCASPERFLKKERSKLISQPIKGTIKRGATAEEDQELQYQLRNDEKELAENMMIVDLVRNDLRRSCATGSVHVEEMFGIYGFKQVSQMISTIIGELRPECDITDALLGTFPMGSMTGAPKISAMQLIEELEETRRGLYSGAFGYIMPNQDFDFNVVIRSLQYNASTGYLSFMVGSAITYDSDPEKEYQECLLKAQAMMQVLG